MLWCHFILIYSKVAVYQLKLGLLESGMLAAMTKYLSLVVPFFISDKRASLTAGVYVVFDIVMQLYGVDVLYTQKFLLC